MTPDDTWTKDRVWATGTDPKSRCQLTCEAKTRFAAVMSFYLSTGLPPDHVEVLGFRRGCLVPQPEPRP